MHNSGLQQVAPENVMNAWPYLEPEIRRALDQAYGERNSLSVLRDCLRKEAQLWFGGSTALVTEIVTYPEYKAVRLLLCGGNMQDVEAYIDGIKDWARGEGAKVIEVCGRRGWIRKLGMEEAYTVARLEI